MLPPPSKPPSSEVPYKLPFVPCTSGAKERLPVLPLNESTVLKVWPESVTCAEATKSARAKALPQFHGFSDLEYRFITAFFL